MDQPFSPQQGTDRDKSEPGFAPTPPVSDTTNSRSIENAQPRPLNVPSRRFTPTTSPLPVSQRPSAPKPTPQFEAPAPQPEQIPPTPPFTEPVQPAPAPVAPPSAQPRAIDSIAPPTPPVGPGLPRTPQPTPMQPSAPPVQPEKTPEQVIDTAEANDRRRSLLGTLRGFLSLVVFVVTVVIAAMLINQFVFQSYFVDGTSMTPTLQNNDRLIIDKVGKTFSTIQQKPYIPARGEIVVLDSAILDQYGHDEQLIKRVIGLPGDTVVIRDGVVTIKNDQNPDGFNIDEQLGLDLEPTYTESPMEVKVPEGQVFVMGDNRTPNGSFDSRSFGPVDSAKVQGRLAARIFPFNEAKMY